MTAICQTVNIHIIHSLKHLKEHDDSFSAPATNIILKRVRIWSMLIFVVLL